jgi:phosphomannomutase / phosphoglucomutase
MHNDSAHVWRAYDIRGRAGDEISVAFARRLGRSLGRFLLDRNREEVAVARDARLSSPELHQALIEGLEQEALEIYDLGEAPTPALYFAVDGMGFDAGIMVTASHNPPGDNGFKFRLNGASVLHNEIEQLRSIFNTAPAGRGGPSSREAVCVKNLYIDAICSDCQPPAGSHKVVIDAGNGVAGPWAVELFRRLGAEVIPLHCEPDGTFPSHPPDPTRPANVAELRETVLRTGASLGIGLDGDGDRVAAISKEGRHLFGDRLMAIFAQDILKWRTGQVVHDVKCSMLLEDVVQSLGGGTVMSPTGYPWVQKYMQEHCAVLGGEQSSHICFSDRWFGYDDGLYAAARLLALADGLDERDEALPSYPSTPELRLPVSEGKKWDVLPKLRDGFSDFAISELDGLRCTNEDGWLLVRPSNTEACLSVRIEGRSRQGLKQLAAKVASGLTSAGVSAEHLSPYL